MHKTIDSIIYHRMWYDLYHHEKLFLGHIIEHYSYMYTHRWLIQDQLKLQYAK